MSSAIVGSRGLLLVSSRCNQLASRVRQGLVSAKERTCQTLFICLVKDSYRCPQTTAKITAPPSQSSAAVAALSHAARVIYAQATDVCPSLDVRFLARDNCASESVIPPEKIVQNSCGHQTTSSKLINNKSINWILAESCISRDEIDHFISLNITAGQSSTQRPSLHVLDTITGLSRNEDTEIVQEQNGQLLSTDKTFSIVVLGGTFDRIHNGHKVLLTEAALRCSSEIIVGVTDDSMILKKCLSELIQPTEVRIESVKDFLDDIAPNLTHRVVPISDPFGPAIVDEDIELIVVSEETMRGANKINEIRQEKNLSELLIHSIPIFEETGKESEQEEDKISSSSKRIRLLGQRLQPPLKSPELPYIIGLTGGIASGKTKIREYLADVRGIPTIDCDKLGHEAYRRGTPCFDRIVATFGNDIVNPDGEIERKILGTKVFGNPEELKKLTDIVWPEIRNMAQNQISEFSKRGDKLIIVEAAVLVEAAWDSLCHEIWVAFVPRTEAISRIQKRDSLLEDRAAQRVDSQLSNKERLNKATFAFSSLWEVDFTRKQIEKALKNIQPIVDAL